MRLSLSHITRIALVSVCAGVFSGAFAGCGTKTPLTLPPAAVPAAKAQAAQPVPGHHSNAPGAAQ